MASSRDTSGPGFFEAFLGLLLQPGETTEQLLSAPVPPYIVRFLILGVAALYVPLLFELNRYGLGLFQSDVLFSITILCFFSLLVFLVIEALFLNLLGVNISVPQLLGIIAYCLVPATLALLLIYLFNYLSVGRLSLIQYLITGNFEGEDRFIRVMPIVVAIVLMAMLLVFHYGIRFIGEYGHFTGIVLSAFSLLPLYVALLVGLFLAEIARGGTIKIFMRLLSADGRWGIFSP